MACLSSATNPNPNDADVASDGEDSGTTHPVYPGLQFCASRYTDRIYLYTKVPQPVPECDCTNGITARPGSLEEQKCVLKIFTASFVYSLLVREYDSVSLTAVKLLTPSMSMPNSIAVFEKNMLHGCTRSQDQF